MEHYTAEKIEKIARILCQYRPDAIRTLSEKDLQGDCLRSALQEHFKMEAQPNYIQPNSLLRGFAELVMRGFTEKSIDEIFQAWLNSFESTITNIQEKHFGDATNFGANLNTKFGITSFAIGGTIISDQEIEPLYQATLLKELEQLDPVILQPGFNPPESNTPYLNSKQPALQLVGFE